MLIGRVGYVMHCSGFHQSALLKGVLGPVVNRRGMFPSLRKRMSQQKAEETESKS